MKNLAIVGCGLRGNSYLRSLKTGFGKEWRLVAAADPDKENLDYVRQMYGSPETEVFENGPAMYDSVGDNIDAVIVATPNDLHKQAVVPAIERKLTVLLEKPIANTADDCLAIWKAWQKAGEPPLIIGFVMRYCPFYRKIRELIDSGVLGQTLSVEANEQMGPTLSSLFMRGWRRQTKYCGSLIAEKCSHDMDLLNWMVGAEAVKVNSFASRIRFIPNPEAAMHCKDCKFIGTCRYSVQKLCVYSFNYSPEMHPKARQQSDLCVFNGERDIPDNQSVQIIYGNGVIVNFLLTMDQPRTNRFIRIMGTKAMIEANLSDNQISVIRSYNDNLGQITTETIPIHTDGSGHHGGDGVIAEHFKDMLRGKTVKPAAGLREGIEASLICFGAEQARRLEKAVDIGAYRREIF